MNSKEIAPHPTGNFPSIKEEFLLRFGFMDKSNPVLKIIRTPADKNSVYTKDSLIYINLASHQSKEELYLPPLNSTEVYQNTSIFAPSYLAQIITGLEEANHLHLNRIYRQHKPNYCRRSDHRFPERLWQASVDNSVSYRAKLWHEFAALVVQRAYLNYYVLGEYPKVVAEFNDFYSEVKKERQKWVRQKKK